MDRTEVEERLRKAFTSDPPPTGDQLVELGGHVDERMKIREVFTGRRWWELAPELVMEHDDAISYMAPEGRRYYLPAYLTATLYADPEWFFSDMVIYHLYLPLRHPEGDPIRTKFERFLELLSTEEKSAIRTYLEYASDHLRSEAAEEALIELWHRF